MSEETFVRVLERRADDVRPRHLDLEDVRRSAGRIQRRRRAAVAGGVAAAVAAAILVPTTLLGGSPKSAEPEPVPPGPTITPGQTVAYDLDAPPLGDAPRVLYERAADSVAIDVDGEHALPEGTLQVVPYGDGYLALAVRDNTNTFGLSLYQLDAGFAPGEDLGPVGERIALSQDGRRVAWMELAPESPALLVVAEDGQVVQQLPLPGVDSGYPVGFTEDGTVYAVVAPDGEQTWEVAVGDQRAPVDHLIRLMDASPVSDLVVGSTRFDTKKNLLRAGVVTGSELLWEKCCYTLEDLSPDGSLVIGYPDEGIPSYRRLTVLDARSGEKVVEFDGGRLGTVVEAAWEDDGHVLAVVQQDNRQAILRLGLDGTVERTTDFERTGGLSVTWFLGGRPWE